MTRTHRRWHVWLWLVLAPLLAVGFVLALALRPGVVLERSGAPMALDLDAPQREVKP